MGYVSRQLRTELFPVLPCAQGLHVCNKWHMLERIHAGDWFRAIGITNLRAIRHLGMVGHPDYRRCTDAGPEELQGTFLRHDETSVRGMTSTRKINNRRLCYRSTYQAVFHLPVRRALISVRRSQT
jgi:hypothetical protein